MTGDSMRWDGTSNTGGLIKEWVRSLGHTGRFHYQWAGMQWDAAVYYPDQQYVKLAYHDLVVHRDGDLVVHREGKPVQPEPLPRYANPVNDFDIGDIVRFERGTTDWEVTGKGGTTGLSLRSLRTGYQRSSHTFEVKKVIRNA